MILQLSAGMTTFVVDDVEEARTPLETVPLARLVGEALWFAPAGHTRVMDTGGLHPVVAAVHRAFAEHRPLVLSPDVIWLTIAQGFAQHVRLNAEQLRPRLVRHEGRRVLEVSVDSLPRREEEFRAVLDGFRERLRGELGPGLPRLLSCDFSTTTDIERMAGDIVLMDVMSPYFDFYLTCICGIPRITLLGTPEDWHSIRRRIDVIAEFDLSWWTSSLVPIADEFIRAAEGKPDRKLWQELYKPVGAYGGDKASGWLMRLFPYVDAGGRLNHRNPMLEVSHAELMEEAKRGDTRFGARWLAPDAVPAHLSSVPIHVKDLREEATRVLWSMEGGVLAVEVDAAGALVPRAGVIARQGSTSVLDVVERILAEHEGQRASKAAQVCLGLAELTALFDHLDSATLFARTNPWRIRPVEEQVEIHILLEGDDICPVRGMVDLPDGTLLAHRSCNGRWRESFVLLRAELLHPKPPSPDGIALTRLDSFRPGMPQSDTRQPVADIPIVGRSLIALLADALDHGGDVKRLPRLASLADELKPPPRPRTGTKPPGA
ncbi:DUF4419 domain-containing protein [Myxococcus stipitatus]|uniref:DUF4419 domain-containing protein n=1 Tax=Myxococcus stipitatus TaxID=83455 RepID=UPI001F3F22A8|nr:DUF4419 domain-containing protein [Myxococcus stipitatus]MCE9668944.1 DUF4419 domain-containing protein [Myxococcus stipitatus]